MEWKRIQVIQNIGLFKFIIVIRLNKIVFFCLRVLHQQAKVSESNAMTPRLRQPHDQSPLTQGIQSYQLVSLLFRE